MEIFRATNPKVMDMIGSSVIDGVDGQWYKKMMKDRPNEVCVIVFVDGGKVVGHSLSRIAQDATTGVRICWLDSTRHYTGIANSKIALDVLVDWCRDVAKVKTIMTAVERGIRSLKRTYGFEKMKTILYKNI